jgi:hypothetical protein
MSFEELNCVEILLAVAAPEFRRPLRIVLGERVFMEGCTIVKRLLARDAVEAFGYKQINVRLHFLVRLHAPSLVDTHATRLTGVSERIVWGAGPDRRMYPFAANVMTEELLFAGKIHFAAGTIQTRAGNGRRRARRRRRDRRRSLVEALVSLHCTRIQKETSVHTVAAPLSGTIQVFLGIFVSCQVTP